MVSGKMIIINFIITIFALTYKLIPQRQLSWAWSIEICCAWDEMSHLNIAPSLLYGVLLYCLVYILIIISYFGGARQKSFSRYHCELRPCGSLRKLVTLSVTQGDYAVHLLSLLLRDGFTRKNCCSFGFCPNERGEGPAQFFCPPFISAIFGQ